MGMLDSFYAKVTCPYCKNENELEFQTKLAGKMLSVYNIGDRIEWYFMEVNHAIFKDGIADCKCGKYLYGDIVIKDNVFKEVKSVRLEELTSSLKRKTKQIDKKKDFV